MKKAVISSVISILMLASPISYAKLVQGSGALSCGSYLEKDVLQKDLTAAWALGYVSALNMDWPGKEDAFAKKLDGSTVTAALDKYCRDNPLKYVSDAANSLFYQLIVRATK